MFNKKRFKIVIIKSAINFVVIVASIYILAAFAPFIYYESIYHFHSVFNPPVSATTNYKISGKGTISDIVIGPSTDQLKPANTSFSIVIPKIDVNEQIVDNVNPNDNSQIVKDLKNGVGHATGTSYPDQSGNTYLFAHSSSDIFSISIYNAVFTLVRELNPGDIVIVFYNNRRYNYIVYDKLILPPSDTSFITSKSSEPTLTLQTCDPPGLNINRLYVRANLASISN